MATEVIRVEGLRQLALAARKLNDEVKKKIAVTALIGGARIVRNAARALTPVLSSKYQDDPRRAAGTIRRQIVAVPVRKGDFPEEVVAIVGVRLLSKAAVAKFKRRSPGRSAASNPNDPYYWWFVEAGTRAHRHRSKSIQGVRMLKRGFEGNATNAANQIKNSGQKAILKFGNGLAR